MIVCPRIEELLGEGADFEAIARTLLRLAVAGEIDADDADQLLGLVETARRAIAKEAGLSLDGDLDTALADLARSRGYTLTRTNGAGKCQPDG